MCSHGWDATEYQHKEPGQTSLYHASVVEVQLAKYSAYIWIWFLVPSLINSPTSPLLELPFSLIIHSLIISLHPSFWPCLLSCPSPSCPTSMCWLYATFSYMKYILVQHERSMEHQLLCGFWSKALCADTWYGCSFLQRSLVSYFWNWKVNTH